MRTYCLSLITVLAALILGGRSVGYAGPSADPNGPAPASSQASTSADDSVPPKQGIAFGNSDSNLPDQSGTPLGIPELFVRMMFAIALVVGLGVVALYLSKRVLPKMARASAKEIRIIETVYLGPRKALHLVEVGRHRLLIGSTHDTITPLATVSEAWLDVSKPPTDEMVNL